MTRIIEHRQGAAPDEEVFELRVFQLRDGDVRGCVVVRADLAAAWQILMTPAAFVAQSGDLDTGVGQRGDQSAVREARAQPNCLMAPEPSRRSPPS
jgi:hypothetical protein